MSDDIPPNSATVLTTQTKVTLSLNDWAKIVVPMIGCTIAIIVFIKEMEYDAHAAVTAATNAEVSASLANDNVRKNQEDLSKMKDELNSTFTSLLGEVKEMKGYLKGLSEKASEKK